MNMVKIKEVSLRVARFVARESVRGIAAGWLVALAFFVAIQIDPGKTMSFIAFLQAPGTIESFETASLQAVVLVVPLYVCAKIMIGLIKKEKTEV